MPHRVPLAMGAILTTALIISSTGAAALGAQGSPGGFSETPIEAPIEEIPEYPSADVGQDHFPQAAQPATDATAGPRAVAGGGCSSCQGAGRGAGAGYPCAGPGACSGCTQHTHCRQVPYAYATGPVRDLAGRMWRGRGMNLRMTSRIGMRSRLRSRRAAEDSVTLRGPDANSPDLFYNYYQGANAEHTAGMYPAPYAIPSITGQTYFTYQPFLPHEYMYTHSRSYYRMANFNQGLNRTHVTYKPNAATSMRQMFHWIFEPVR